MTSFTIPIVQTDDCDDLPAPARVPDPIPLPPRHPQVTPGDVWDGGWTDSTPTATDPTPAELLSMYGTADPDALTRIPFVLAEDIAAAERYAREQVLA